jgi:stage III sporulation protein AH
MNTKRQTIWLVSMLSLMVILSAYYLFTDSVDDIDMVTESENTGQIATADEVLLDEHATEEQFASGLLDDITDATLIEEVDQLAVEQVEDEQLTADVPDEEVLENIQAGAQNGEDYLSALVIQRNEALYKDAERLLEITSNPKSSNEEVVKAEEELQQIEDMQYRISDLEDQLMQDFENVVITEEKGKWKAVVQADKLERSQAVTIFDMMILNLQITPSKIAGVQLVQ